MARAAFMFRYFGATNVRILSGGLKKWTAEGRPTVAGEYSEGCGLPEPTKDDDFDYQVVDPELLVSDISYVQRVAYHLVNQATEH